MRQQRFSGAESNVDGACMMAIIAGKERIQKHLGDAGRCPAGYLDEMAFALNPALDPAGRIAYIVSIFRNSAPGRVAGERGR
jgi:hypothetical protein